MLQLMTYIMAYIAYGTTPVNSFCLTGQYVNISHSSSSSEEGVAVELVGEHVTVVELISAQPKPMMGKSQL